MPAVTGYFQGADGVRLFYRYFECPDAIGTLVILHGHGEHSGRYEKFEEILKEARLSIAVYDGRCYGRSEGRDVYVDSFEELLSDVTAFTDFLKKTHSLEEKFFLLGHSLGGLIAVHWALRFPEKIRALILSSPFLGLCLPTPLLWLNGFLNRFKPDFIYQNPVYPPHLTHNPEEVRLYKEDRLIKRKISARLIHEVISYQKKLKALERIEFAFPFYVLAAGLERVVDLPCVKSFYEKVSAPAKKMKIFEGFYHEIFNELEQKQAFEFLNLCIKDALK